MNKIWPIIAAIVIALLLFFVKSINEDEVIVTALGDSLAYGVGDTSENGYTGDLKKRYEQENGKKLIVKDFGVPNDTSTDLIHRLKNKEIYKSAQHADFVLINIGTNDFLKSTDRLKKFDKAELLQNEQIYRNNLNQIIKTVQEKDHPKTIYILGIYNPKVKGTDISKINTVVDSWNKSTKQVTKAHKNVAFIPTDDIFIHKNKAQYFSDLLHPNKKGYELIGKRVFDTIKTNSNYR